MKGAVMQEEVGLDPSPMTGHWKTKKVIVEISGGGTCSKHPIQHTVKISGGRTCSKHPVQA